MTTATEQAQEEQIRIGEENTHYDPSKDPRTNALNDIMRRRDEEIASEASPDAAPGSEPAPEPEVPAKPETPAAVEKVIKAKRGDQDVAIPEDAVLTLKVDGEEMTVTAADLVRTAQKDAAASRRLAAASERLRAADERLAEADRRLKESSRPAPAPAAPEVQAAQGDPAREVVDKLLEGDTEGAADALRRVSTGRGNATPDTDAITEKVMGEIERRSYARDVGAANKWFNTEHPDLAGDPKLRALVNQESGRLLSENPELSPRENLSQAAEAVRAWLQSRAPAKEPVVSDGLAQRRETKRLTVDRLPVANQRQAPPQEEKPQTAADAIAAMRKSRGLS